RLGQPHLFADNPKPFEPKWPAQQARRNRGGGNGRFLHHTSRVCDSCKRVQHESEKVVYKGMASRPWRADRTALHGRDAGRDARATSAARHGFNFPIRCAPWALCGEMPPAAGDRTRGQRVINSATKARSSTSSLLVAASFDFAKSSMA